MDPNELEASVGILDRDVLAGLRTAIANVKAVAKAQVRDEPVMVELPEGHTVEVVERPVRSGGGLRAGRAGAVSVDRRDGGDHRARGGCARDRRMRAARAGRHAHTR